MRSKHTELGHGRTDLDEVFRALSHPTRRTILTVVRERGPQKEAEVLPEGTGEGVEVGQKERLELHHRHLPLLDEVGYLDWDRDSGSIAKGDRFGMVESCLGALDDLEDETSNGAKHPG